MRERGKVAEAFRRCTFSLDDLLLLGFWSGVFAQVFPKTWKHVLAVLHICWRTLLEVPLQSAIAFIGHTLVSHLVSQRPRQLSMKAFAQAAPKQGVLGPRELDWPFLISWGRLAHGV